MFFNTNQRWQGDWFGRVEAKATNRTGAQLDKGDLAAYNLDFVDTGYDDFDESSTDPRRNVVAVTTENASRFVVVALETIANGKEGAVGLLGIFDVEMNGANPGEFLHATNGQTYATPLTKTELDGLTVPTGIIGVALESTSGAQVKKAYFNGAACFNLVGGGA